MTTAYKSKIVRYKMDEDPLQRRIYFLTFVESLEMIFLQYTETSEVTTDDQKIEGNNNKDYSKKTVMNILHSNINVHIKRLIA